MFGGIAHRYDVLNHLLSLGLDFHWWREMAKAADAKQGVRILDVASGTGDSALALAKRGAYVVTSDFTMPMLALGPKKFKLGGVADLILGSVGADAQRLPFRDSSFDALTICYGIRNVEHREKAYAEFNRVLKPGGKLVILEFSRPRRKWLRLLYSAYSRYLLPKVGGWISGDKNAYTYLPESIKRFPSQPDLALELKNAGFVDVTWRDMCFGIVAIHISKSQTNSALKS